MEETTDEELQCRICDKSVVFFIDAGFFYCSFCNSQAEDMFETGDHRRYYPAPRPRFSRTRMLRPRRSSRWSIRNISDKGGYRRRAVSITRYSELCRNRCGGGGATPVVECCVCLSRFEAEEEVSELSCKHFFHKGCLDKWFDKQHVSCPLCRSII